MPRRAPATAPSTVPSTAPATAPATARATATVIEIDTPHGPARAHVTKVRGAVGALVLGHGAGGGVGSRDLVAAAEVAQAQKLSVALIEQPYRVAGRRSPAPATQLDAAWIAVVAHLRAKTLKEVPIVCGGRSSGARVACRTAADTGAVAVLCLAFPLRPPGRRASSAEPPSRQDELDSVTVPVLVVQGAGDPFGRPDPGPSRTVVTVAGNHSLRSDLGAVRTAVGEWLPQVL